MAVILLTILQPTSLVCVVPPPAGPKPDPLLDHGYVGVTITRTDPVVVSEVVPGGPAERAGIKVDDRIVRVNGRDARTSDVVIGWVASCRPGETVTIDVVRDGETIQLKVRCIVRDPKEFEAPPGAPSPYIRIPDPCP